MDLVTSADGTRIAFDRNGSGPAVILVVGAFNDRTTGAPLGERLAADHTVYTYDRRGRGDSEDTLPYAVAREVEDIAALIDSAGGEADLFGYSSGAALALHSAVAGLGVRRLALYDPPLRPDAGENRLAAEIAEAVAAGRRGDAVELFQIRAVGIPEEVVVQMRHAPFRAALEKIAHTLVYDLTILGDPDLPGRLATVTAPTLVLTGEKMPPWMHDTARRIAGTVADGRYASLAGQDHTYDPDVLGTALREFLDQ